jgi:hypothetical protein
MAMRALAFAGVRTRLFLTVSDRVYLSILKAPAHLEGGRRCSGYESK